MPRKSQSTGYCLFCGREMAKGGLTRHLASCDKRQEAIRAVEEGKGTTQQLFHLQVGDAYLSDFWLHLEVNGSATLKQLDDYLRAIWLECCGHLSRFSVGGWSGSEIPMSRKIEKVFSPGVVLTHIYDFGSSSETILKAASIRQGKPLTGHPIFLMARNAQPALSCAECGEPATHYCVDCLIENGEMLPLCDIHAAEHPHDEYGGLMPLVNSPRVGICAYDGPAEPPY
jgi:hypothetical protein